MTIDGGTAIVLAYVLVSMGVIIAFLLAAFVIGRFIGWLRQHRLELDAAPDGQAHSQPTDQPPFSPNPAC